MWLVGVLLQNGKLSEERKIYRITANNLRNEVNQLRAQYARLLKQYTNIGRMPSDPADGVAVTPSPPATLPYKPSSSVEGASATVNPNPCCARVLSVD